MFAALLLIGEASANCSPIAQITAYEGQVSIKPAGKAVNKSPGQPPVPLCSGDEVYAFHGKALIKTDKDAITVGANSPLVVKATEQAVVGNLGASIRFSYMAIGDAMNLASRLKTSARKFGCDIVISKTTDHLCLG